MQLGEGVRIIGADEAAEAIERGDIASRRTDDELRFGDRPPAPPAGPRPALRFPLDAPLPKALVAQLLDAKLRELGLT